MAALGWILSDDRRASRFLDLTGLTPDILRARIAQPDTHRAIFEFLCGHEADLVGAAEALGVPPERLAQAKEQLER